MSDLKIGIKDWLETLSPDQLGQILHTEVMKASPDVQFIQDLLDVGCQIDARDEDGWTAMHVAANTLNLDMMKFLISKGADVNLRNNRGNTASDIHDSVIRFRKNIHELVRREIL